VKIWLFLLVLILAGFVTVPAHAPVTTFSPAQLDTVTTNSLAYDTKDSNGNNPGIGYNGGSGTGVVGGQCIIGSQFGLTISTLKAPDVIIATLVVNDTTTTVSSITDNLGLSWTLRVNKQAAANIQEWEYYAVAYTTITGEAVTFSGSPALKAGICTEFAVTGINIGSLFDGSPVTNTGTTSPTTATFTTTNPSDLILWIDAVCNSNFQAGNPQGWTGIATINSQLWPPNCGTNGASQTIGYLTVSSVQTNLGPVTGISPAGSWVLIVDFIKATQELTFGVGWSHSNQGFYDSGTLRYWEFYSKILHTCEGIIGGNNRCLQLGTSLDGVSWALTNLDLEADSCCEGNYGLFSIFHSGSTVYLARVNDTGTTNAILFRKGTLTSTGTITWGTESPVQTSTTHNFNGLSLSLDTANQAYIGYIDCADSGCATEQAYAIRSSGTDYTTWTQRTGLGSSCTIAACNKPTPTLRPFLSNMYATVSFGTSNPFRVTGYKYDTIARTWSAAEKVFDGSSLGHSDAFLVSAGASLYYVYAQSSDNSIYSATRNGDGTWSPTLLTGPLCNPNNNDIFDCFTVSYDSLSTSLYVLFYNQTFTTIQLGKGFQAITTRLLINTGAAPKDSTISAPTQSDQRLDGSTVIGFLYTDGYSKLEFSNIIVTPDPPNGGGTPPNNSAFTFAFSSCNVFGVSLPCQLTQFQAVLLIPLFPLLVALLAEPPVGVSLTHLKKNYYHRWRSKDPDRLIQGSIVVASVTLGLDYAFHFSLTNPMEVPAYFAMKFLSAFVIAYLLIPRIGTSFSAAVFTLWVDLYYGLFVVLLGVYWLSSSPNQVIQIDGITNQFVLLPLWTLFHGLFFFVGAEIATNLIKGLTAIPEKRTSLI
jgi:hypothetical protein